VVFHDGIGTSGQMVEVVLMGAIALRVDGKLRWDASAGSFTNAARANDMVKPAFRTGWEV